MIHMKWLLLCELEAFALVCDEAQWLHSCRHLYICSYRDIQHMVQIQLLLQSVKCGEPHHVTKLSGEKCLEQQWEYSMLLPPLEKRTLNWALAGRPLKSPLPLLDNMMVMAIILTTTTMIIYILWWSVRLFVCEWWKMITVSRGVVRSACEW